MKKREIELFWKEFGRLPETESECIKASLLYIKDKKTRELDLQLTDEEKEETRKLILEFIKNENKQYDKKIKELEEECICAGHVLLHYGCKCKEKNNA